MPQYHVHFNQTVSATVTVEAETPEAAIEAAQDSEDMPGSITHGAFGDCAVDEDGDWKAAEVTDGRGFTVWTGRS